MTVQLRGGRRHPRCRVSGCADLPVRIGRGAARRRARAFSVLPVLLLAACAASPDAAPPTDTTTPDDTLWNVVLLLADDLAWNQVGYHGTTFYETPNIDAIAAAACSSPTPTRRTPSARPPGPA